MENSKTDRPEPSPIQLGRSPKVIAITSGKGGVGKTNVVANLAVALSRMGQQVMILDADLGLGNLDVLLGIVPKFTMEHVLLGQKTLSEVMVEGPGGIQILPASSGREQLTHITPEQKLILQAEFDRLEKAMNVFLIDTGAGISTNVLYFNTVAQEIIVVASPEPTSIADAYAVMKVLSKRYAEKRFNLLVNMVRGETEAREVHRRLSRAAERFLDIVIHYAGFIPEDDYLRMAVSEQRAVVEFHPQSRSSQGFMRLAGKVMEWPVDSIPKGGVQFLWRRMLLAEAESPFPTAAVLEHRNG
jgi:flagellar biosynthesis protein FlhG